jgi:hypothetical protein
MKPETAMPESQSLRLAAILATDIAGYSALMGADEKRTVRDPKGQRVASAIAFSGVPVRPHTARRLCRPVKSGAMFDESLALSFRQTRR